MGEEQQRYRVGAAATAAGVGVQTLHYYERRGLLSPQRRAGAGYREYGGAEVRRVRAIKRAQTLGFTLREIRELIGLAESRRSPGRVGEIAARKVDEIEAKIRDLRRMRTELRRTVETCRCRGDLSRCDVLGALAPPAEVAAVNSKRRTRS